MTEGQIDGGERSLGSAFAPKSATLSAEEETGEGPEDRRTPDPIRLPYKEEGGARWDRVPPYIHPVEARN